MTTARDWLAGARPRTLPAAVAPVVVGSGAAAGLAAFDPLAAALALLVALALQVAVNYANDYSDGVRGTDTDRVGPLRLVASGRAAPRTVRLAAGVAAAVAAAAGLALVARSGQWWLLGVGVVCLAAAWFYTGGSRPYGYAGLGELAVFVFFGLVAVCGTTLTQAGRVDAGSLLGGVGIGALAAAILVANNLRDVPTDAASGKRTLAVRLGERRTRWLYAALLAVAAAAAVVAAAVVSPAALLAPPAFVLAVPALRAVLGGARGAALIPVLGATGRLELGYGLLLGAGLALG